QLAGEEVAESTPFVGWVIRIMAILGTTADIVTTTAEIGTNPCVISNTVSFTNAVTVVVSHDPTDFEFPLTATHFEVLLTVSGKALDPVVVPISDQERSNDTLTAVVPNVPSTGDNATVTVVFLTDTGYPIAQSAVVDANGNRIAGDVTFLNKLP